MLGLPPFACKFDLHTPEDQNPQSHTEAQGFATRLSGGVPTRRSENLPIISLAEERSPKGVGRPRPSWWRGMSVRLAI